MSGAGCRSESRLNRVTRTSPVGRATGTGFTFTPTGAANRKCGSHAPTAAEPFKSPGEEASLRWSRRTGISSLLLEGRTGRPGVECLSAAAKSTRLWLGFLTGVVSLAESWGLFHPPKGANCARLHPVPQLCRWCDHDHHRHRQASVSWPHGVSRRQVTSLHADRSGSQRSHAGRALQVRMRHLRKSTGV